MRKLKVTPSKNFLDQPLEHAGEVHSVLVVSFPQIDSSAIEIPP